MNRVFKKYLTSFPEYFVQIVRFHLKWKPQEMVESLSRSCSETT